MHSSKQNISRHMSSSSSQTKKTSRRRIHPQIPTILRKLKSSILSELIKDCKKNHQGIFNQPVNLTYFPNYLNVIGGKPMDLGTINEKFYTGQDYKMTLVTTVHDTVMKFSADLEQIWSNAKKYNQMGSWPYEAAVTYEERCRKQFRNIDWSLLVSSQSKKRKEHIYYSNTPTLKMTPNEEDLRLSVDISKLCASDEKHCMFIANLLLSKGEQKMKTNDDEMTIDLTTLTPDIKSKLKDYVLQCAQTELREDHVLQCAQVRDHDRNGFISDAPRNSSPTRVKNHCSSQTNGTLS